MVPCLVDVLHQAVDHGVGLGQEVGRVSPQHRQSAQLVGDVEDGLLRLFDLRFDDMTQLEVGAVGPRDDVHIPGITTDAPSTEADLPDQQVGCQSHERDEEDDRQPGQADRRLRLAPDDDRQHDQPDRPLEPEEYGGPGEHRPTPGQTPTTMVLKSFSC